MKVMRKRKGFTLIEIVLVLAIAGLMILMVFIALPAMQRAQRNTERKNALSIIIAGMTQWTRHNAVGSVSDNYTKAWTPAGFCTFYVKYVGPDVVDPSSGEPYRIALWGTTKVINCITKEVTDRGMYDPDVHGRSPNSHWANMEVGDIQYDDVAACKDEDFDDDLGKSSGVKLFAFRIRLEGGGATCMDSGGGSVGAITPIGIFSKITDYEL